MEVSKHGDFLKITDTNGDVQYLRISEIITVFTPANLGGEYRTTILLQKGIEFKVSQSAEEVMLFLEPGLI